MAEIRQLDADLFAICGSTYCGVLRSGDRAILIDCPELPPQDTLASALAQLGVRTVEKIFLTQHRRTFSGGLYREPAAFRRAEIFAAAPEIPLLQTAEDLRRRSAWQFHRYDSVPDRFLPFDGVEQARPLPETGTFVWRGFSISAIEIGACSRGQTAYLVQKDAFSVLFCGAFVRGGGLLREIHTLQRALPDMMGYHGHLGGLPQWLVAAERLQNCGASLLVGDGGEPEQDVSACIALARDRLLAYAQSYAESSAVRYYFPKEFALGFERQIHFSPPPYAGVTSPFPDGVVRLGESTSFLIRSQSGRCVLIDCGDEQLPAQLASMRAAGIIAGIDFCWVTHYHDDHLNGLGRFSELFDCTVLSTAAVAEVCNRPKAYFLPALSDVTACVQPVADGARWNWNEYTFTALHFPGQTLHHAGLLVERADLRALLCGDSFAPTGLDDYCSGNRNLFGEGRGYRRCLSLLRTTGAEIILNQHQSEAFRFGGEFLGFLEQGMDKKERQLRLLLGKDPDLGTDNAFVRVYPFVQAAAAGETCRFSVQVTAHGRHTLRLRPVAPDGWESPRGIKIETNGLSSGSAFFACGDLPRDQSVEFVLHIPPGSRGRYCVAVDCTVDSEYLGSFAHAIVECF